MPTLRFASEHQEQSALFEWAGYYKKIVPELELLFAIPNGGLRHPAVARKLQKEGVQAGVPDTFLPVARGGRHGLYIEMKSATGKVSACQQLWHKLLAQQGYKVVVCWSWTEARDVLLAYLRTEI